MLSLFHLGWVIKQREELFWGFLKGLKRGGGRDNDKTVTSVCCRSDCKRRGNGSRRITSGAVKKANARSCVLTSTFLASLIDSMQLNTWQDVIKKCVNM